MVGLPVSIRNKKSKRKAHIQFYRNRMVFFRLWRSDQNSTWYFIWLIIPYNFSTYWIRHFFSFCISRYFPCVQILLYETSVLMIWLLQKVVKYWFAILLAQWPNRILHQFVEPMSVSAAKQSAINVFAE